MAASSVVAAVQQIYHSIPAAVFGGVTRPPIFLGEAAQTKSDASQQRVPYVVMFDEGIVPAYDSSFGGVEGGTLRLELYALLVDATSGITLNSMSRAVKWGGQTPATKAGLDWGTLPLFGPNYSISLKRTKEQVSYAGFTTQGPNGESARVHKCELVYRVVVGLNASATPQQNVTVGNWTGFWGVLTYP